MEKKILILGCTGMLGHTLFLGLSSCKDLSVYATARSQDGLPNWFPGGCLEKIITGVDAFDFPSIEGAFAKAKPDVVINCIGHIKQLPNANDPILSIYLNSLFPHIVEALCRNFQARLIHISTDCVFEGDRGNYSESDIPDAKDIYGRSKLLGEVNGPRTLVIRTSLIGHEIKNKLGLVEWFLSQKTKTNGYSKAIFSGLPTIEFADLLIKQILPNGEMNGIYNISSWPISKFELLKLIAARYGKEILIQPYDKVNLDRSLDSGKFRKASGYQPPQWPELVEKMYLHYANSKIYR
ncbi:MAG: SDR family oxidoreductase [Syntrophaceae bacterium]